jgi:hypothetical protein
LGKRKERSAGEPTTEELDPYVTTSNYQIKKSMPKKYQDVPSAVRRVLSMRDEVEYHLSRENRTVEQEFTLIINKESKLPKRLRDFILNFYEVEESEEINGEQ